MESDRKLIPDMSDASAATPPSKLERRGSLDARLKAEASSRSASKPESALEGLFKSINPFENTKKTDAPVPDDVTNDEAKELLELRKLKEIRLLKKQPTPGVLLTHEDRLERLLEDVANRSPPKLAEYIRMATPILTPLIIVLVKVLNVVGPVYIKLFSLLHTLLSQLPWDLFQAAMGLGLCFFGGGYLASIAAAEAFYTFGWTTTRAQLELIYEDALAVHTAYTEDDKKDDDGDGVADVKQISVSELLDRKVRVAAGAVRDPQRLSAALGGLYVGWLSVQGVLRVKFAKTINLALSCSQFVEYYACKLVVPLVVPLVAEEFHVWLPVVLKTCTKALFIWFAWSLQQVVSAAQSGLRGGLLFSRGVAAWLNKRGHTSLCGLSLEPGETYLDEAVGFALAALGFYFQWQFGFSLPFPFNIVMFPLDVVEWWIRWSITSEPV